MRFKTVIAGEASVYYALHPGGTCRIKRTRGDGTNNTVGVSCTSESAPPFRQEVARYTVPSEKSAVPQLHARPSLDKHAYHIQHCREPHSRENQRDLRKPLRAQHHSVSCEIVDG